MPRQILSRTLATRHFDISVVAADGFTYEREAILEWFQHSTRSPMTNQELENLELKPNYAIRSILQSLQGSDEASKKSKTKDPHAK